MKTTVLRKYLLKNKEFLYKLKSSTISEAEKELIKATPLQLKLIIHVLHYMSNGEIPIEVRYDIEISQTFNFYVCSSSCIAVENSIFFFSSPLLSTAAVK